jgi:hypothetical protein
VVASTNIKERIGRKIFILLKLLKTYITLF